MTPPAVLSPEAEADLDDAAVWHERQSAFEDMLPDERMPKAFFKFWSIPVPHHPDGMKRNH